jgi:hypothetical protein
MGIYVLINECVANRDPDWKFWNFMGPENNEKTGPGKGSFPRFSHIHQSHQ